MLALIATLEEKGYGYRSANGDVNFAVRKFAGYGKLSGKSIDQLRAGERVAVLDGKHDPLDFVMWKSAKESEPEDAKWPARSAWPTRDGTSNARRCARRCLGEHFDIHGGGQDLQFPHHENEIAQSEAASGGRFVDVWMHNGLLTIDNEKMSKSLGNFFTIREVLERFDGETIRFFMVRTHYRSPFNFSDASLEDARHALRRLYTALDAVAAVGPAEVDWKEPRAAAFCAAMNDDFNTPIAISILFELAAEINRSRKPADAALLKALGATLGLLQQSPRAFLQTGAALFGGADRRAHRRARRGQACPQLRGCRRDPRRARQARHRPQGHRPRHDLGERLIPWRPPRLPPRRRSSPTSGTTRASTSSSATAS
jgi:cysteinyl-tRNA synthetase